MKEPEPLKESNIEPNNRITDIQTNAKASDCKQDRSLASYNQPDN